MFSNDLLIFLCLYGFIYHTSCASNGQREALIENIKTRLSGLLYSDVESIRTKAEKERIVCDWKTSSEDRLKAGTEMMFKEFNETMPEEVSEQNKGEIMASLREEVKEKVDQCDKRNKYINGKNIPNQMLELHKSYYKLRFNEEFIRANEAKRVQILMDILNKYSSEILEKWNNFLQDYGGEFITENAPPFLPGEGPSETGGDYTTTPAVPSQHSPKRGRNGLLPRRRFSAKISANARPPPPMPAAAAIAPPPPPPTTRTPPIIPRRISPVRLGATQPRTRPIISKPPVSQSFGRLPPPRPVGSHLSARPLPPITSTSTMLPTTRIINQRPRPLPVDNTHRSGSATTPIRPSPFKGRFPSRSRVSIESNEHQSKFSVGAKKTIPPSTNGASLPKLSTTNGNAHQANSQSTAHTIPSFDTIPSTTASSKIDCSSENKQTIDELVSHLTELAQHHTLNILPFNTFQIVANNTIYAICQAAHSQFLAKNEQNRIERTTGRSRDSSASIPAGRRRVYTARIRMTSRTKRDVNYYYSGAGGASFGGSPLYSIDQLKATNGNIAGPPHTLDRGNAQANLNEVCSRYSIGIIGDGIPTLQQTVALTANFCSEFMQAHQTFIQLPFQQQQQQQQQMGTQTNRSLDILRKVCRIQISPTGNVVSSSWTIHWNKGAGNACPSWSQIFHERSYQAPRLNLHH